MTTIEWPPIPLYIVFAVVATWSSVLGAELRKDNISSTEVKGLSLLRKVLQWSGIGSATHILIYLLLACCNILVCCGSPAYARLLSVIVHIAVVIAVLIFMATMFTVSFKRTQ